MEISRWTKRESRGSNGGMMIKVSRKEALEIVQSFMNQILTDNPNCARVEHYTNEGEYVSISVQPEEAKGNNHDYFKEYLQRIY